jgi:ubiquitin-protein ligase
VKDLQKMNSDAEEGINASPMEGNIFKWNAFIEGPEKTVW